MSEAKRAKPTFLNFTVVSKIMVEEWCFWVPAVLNFAPTVLPRFSPPRMAKKTPRPSARHERPKRFFLNVFVWDFGGPHCSQFSPHGFPTVLWSLPTVLPRFFGQSPHGSPTVLGLRPDQIIGFFRAPNSHGSPTVLCAVATVLPRLSVQPPQFSDGSLCSPHGFPTVLPRLLPPASSSRTVLAHTWPLGRFFPNRMTPPRVSKRDFLQK